VVDWDAYQYSDKRKKPNPPWRWCRLPRALMDSPEFQHLTWQQRGAFCWLLMLASETGNLIPNESDFLLNRIQLRSKLKLNLIQSGFIEEFTLPADSPEIKRLRRIYSGGPPEDFRTVEGEGEAEAEPHTKTLSGRGANLKSKGGSPPARPPSAGPEKEFKILRPESAHDEQPQGGWDDRPFDEIRDTVLQLARTWHTIDPAEIFRLGGQAARLSFQQCAVAIEQLLQDGDLDGIGETQ
jgi:hypothetical protein